MEKPKRPKKNSRCLGSVLVEPSLFQHSLPKEPLGRHSHPQHTASVTSFRTKLQQRKLEIKLHPRLYASLPTLAKMLVLWGSIEAEAFTVKENKNTLLVFIKPGH